MNPRGRPRTIILQPGDRFGRLEVIAETRSKPRPGRPNGLPAADCLCDCGNTAAAVLVSDLVSGNTASCGCLQADTRRENGSNPAHLAALAAHNRTPAKRERMRELALAGRVGIRKLDPVKAAVIRAEYARGGITQGALAVRYGVAERTIWCVLNGKSWQEPAAGADTEAAS